MDKTIIILAAIVVIIVVAILLLPGHAKASSKATIPTTSIAQNSTTSTAQPNVTQNSTSSTTFNSTTTIVNTKRHPGGSTSTINSGGVQQGLTVSVEPNYTIADVGEPIILSAVVSGGLPAYTYQWYGNDQAITGADNSTVNVTPESAGPAQYYVSVTDSANKTATSNFVNLVVNSGLSTPTFSASANTVAPGGSTTVPASAGVSGGVPPYSYCVYEEYPSGSTYASLGYVEDYCTSTNSTSQALYLSPRPVFGTYYYYLNVTDAANAVATTDGSPISITYTNSTS